MKLLDVNVLLYAVNSRSAHHERVKPWLDAVLSGEETIALPWIVILGFLRISTNPRAFATPLTPAQAFGIVDGWLALPNVVPLDAGEGHWPAMRRLLNDTGTAGNLTTDAHLAAMAIERDAELCSTDADFGRFTALRWTNPAAQ